LKGFILSIISLDCSYFLGKEYKRIKKQASEIVGKYLNDPDDLISFDDFKKEVFFKSEILIPKKNSKRIRVMLLFSNPHPLSVKKGMFLSPNRKNKENLFWPIMNDAGWFSIPKEKRNPEYLCKTFLGGKYQSPFEFVFYCYYLFPTDYPEDIPKIFGKSFFKKVIIPESETCFTNTIKKSKVDAIVTFNKTIFNTVSEDGVNTYINRLNSGKIVYSKLKNFERETRIYLTYPTGWFYHKKYLNLRKRNLERIKSSLCKFADR
tara:strand:+ start:1996 stop:2784 length:789 start_codon:yes stop_codon:yes gene_type:complete